MVNWKVRVKNKTFWIAVIPAVLLLIQSVAAVFGVKLDFGQLGNQLLTVVNAVFALLAILGVVNDPTTAGMNDSARAMTYSAPVVTGNPVTDGQTDMVTAKETSDTPPDSAGS